MIGFVRTDSQVILSASPFCSAAPGIYVNSRDWLVYTASKANIETVPDVYDSALQARGLR